MSLEKLNKHICTFYYGEKHLLVKSAVFLQEGIERGEKCLYYTRSSINDKLTEDFKAKVFNSSQLEYKTITELLINYFKGSNFSLEQTLQRIFFKAKREGYSGLRLLFHPDDLIERLSLNDFIRFEDKLTELVDSLNSYNITILCFYNANALINSEQKPFISTVLEKILKRHSYLLSGNEVYNVKDVVTLNLRQ